MITPSHKVRIFVASDPVDFRKGHDGLAAFVQSQAPAPAHIIAGGMPTEATLAHLLVSKYADHLPLYRQVQIYSRQGIDLDRSRLAVWVGKSAFELTPP